MKKIRLKVTFILFITLMSGCYTNATIQNFTTESLEQKNFINEKFLQVATCLFASATYDANIVTSTPATCGVTTKQLIVFTTSSKGELLSPLVIYDLDRIQSMRLTEGRNQQIQLMTQIGKIVIQMKGPGSIFTNLEKTEKFYNIIQSAGIKTGKSSSPVKMI